MEALATSFPAICLQVHTFKKKAPTLKLKKEINYIDSTHHIYWFEMLKPYCDDQ